MNRFRERSPLWDKKLVIFGTGDASRRLVPLLPSAIAYYVDNAAAQWGQRIDGCPVQPPAKLLEEERDELAVLVASSYYDEISAQLCSMGFTEHIHFFRGEQVALHLFQALIEERHARACLQKREVTEATGEAEGVSGSVVERIAVGGERVEGGNGGKGEQKKRILFVRVDAIGDSILWLDSIRGYLALYSPDRHEYLLACNEASVDLWQSTGYFRKIIPVNRKRFLVDKAYLTDTLDGIAALAADVAIQPTYSREFRCGDAIVYASGAVERIGWDGDGANLTAEERRISDHWYTRLIAATEPALMELERNAAFVRALGLPEHQAAIPKWPLPLETVEGRPYFIIFPGAGNRRRCWPIDRFAAIARRLHEESGWDCCLCGGPGEEELGHAFLDQAGGGMAVTNLIGKLSLSELANWIHGAKLVISNETSAVHMAAAVATTSLCLLGGGHFGRFVPYTAPGEHPPISVYHRMDCFDCNWTCRFALKGDQPWPCIEGISEADLWQRIAALLP
ncbi:hypothetical protein GTO89_08200 [Heliobacterium gestii]|uniref:Glycosyltransferase family 9 protein n=1 Tax=Heliomicrobium gestii TaxID=2699 RepID=A0A845LEZ1_HELGE|nr:glycosyltransferase family 9 protein [Heliomicrobium gestii]MBM7866705.1 ADP-heptose:LPS heptosyltransferase [Heliomicrobium gestii]MZP43015.1 hypothetical protein [Heliomicrobium gestii]